jgi:hypothetical protein
MHAKHADNRELNELSERVIGCAFTVLNTWSAVPPAYRIYNNTVPRCTTETFW